MAETLIPLEEREEERRPSRVEPPRRSGGWVGKLALVLAVVALAVACLALYRTLPPGEDDPQGQTLAYAAFEFPVVKVHFDDALVYFSTHLFLTSSHASCASLSNIGRSAGLI